MSDVISFRPNFFLDTFTTDASHHLVADLLKSDLRVHGGARVAAVSRRVFLKDGINGTTMTPELGLGTFIQTRGPADRIAGEQQYDELPTEVQRRLQPLFGAFIRDRFNGHWFRKNLPSLMNAASHGFVAIAYYPGFSIIMPDNLQSVMIGGAFADLSYKSERSEDSKHDAIFSVHVQAPRSNHDAVRLAENIQKSWAQVQAAVHGRSGDFFDKYRFRVEEFDDAWVDQILSMAPSV